MRFKVKEYSKSTTGAVIIVFLVLGLAFLTRFDVLLGQESELMFLLMIIVLFQLVVIIVYFVRRNYDKIGKSS